MKCDWCEQEIGPAERPVRLSNTQPPWKLQYARSGIAAVAGGFAAAIAAAMQTEPETTLWFHRECWTKFYKLLRGDNP